jgi:TRAP-type mannitol/chloroaromatic compound transport system permease small subunit
MLKQTSILGSDLSGRLQKDTQMIPQSHKVFFGIVLLEAVLVALLGCFAPAFLAQLFSWVPLPPLHARFVGVMYLYGAVFMLGCQFAKQQSEVRFALVMIAIWTATLLLVSLLNLAAFDLTRLPVQIWFVSYLLDPMVALWLAWTFRAQPERQRESTLEPWIKTVLQVQGVLIGLFALGLLLAPAAITTIWPWKITPLLAQLYAGPLLAYSLGSWGFAQAKTPLEVRAVIPAMFVFGAGVLIVSIFHSGLFSVNDTSDWLWFIAFALIALLTGPMLPRVFRTNHTAMR